MARALAIAIAVITLVSAVIFVEHVWWLPPAISTHGPAMDSQFASTFVETGIGFVVSQLLLAYIIWRYRDRGDGRKVSFLPGGPKGTVATAFLLVGLELIGLELVGSKVWASLYYTPVPQDALRVQAQGEQFGFYFRYPGPDGKFGLIHPDKIDPGVGNFFGLDRASDTESRDDVVTATLAIPVNHPVEITLHSKDVSHSFYVPQLRIQQDFVPGMEIPIHFTPTTIGRYEIVCTQLCGLGHHNMRAFLEVMSDQNFQKWIQEQVAAQ
jgi:cytochrome c oxidase subunit II